MPAEGSDGCVGGPGVSPTEPRGCDHGGHRQVGRGAGWGLPPTKGNRTWVSVSETWRCILLWRRWWGWEGGGGLSGFSLE